NPDAQEELQRLGEALRVSSGDAERLAAVAADWIDEDEAPIGRGAEDFDYAALNPPYRAANTLFAQVDEVRALAGVSEGLFRAMRPYLCAHPTSDASQLNVNTLRSEDAPLLVAALGEKLEIDAARDLIGERPAGGWPDAQSFFLSERLKDIAF